MDVPKGVLTLRFWFSTTRVERACQCVTARAQKFWSSSCYHLAVERIIRYPHLKFLFPLEYLSHPWNGIYGYIRKKKRAENRKDDEGIEKQAKGSWLQGVSRMLNLS